MGNNIKQSQVVQRWHQKMPPFFRRIVQVCCCIVATALAVNQVMEMGHATPHEWWNDIYPLLLSVPTGMAVVCKLTVAGGYKHIDPDKILRGEGHVLDQDIDHLQADSPEQQ